MDGKPPAGRVDRDTIRPISCSSPSPVERKQGRGLRSRTGEVSGSVNSIPSLNRSPINGHPLVIPKINRSTKDLRTYLRLLEGLEKEKIPHEQEVSPITRPTASHSPINTVSGEGVTQAERYAQRMRRIKRQVQEMADMGLISSRGNEPMLNDFDANKMTPTQKRVQSTEFWGKKEKMQLIKKLGFTEAYREFQARKSIQKPMMMSPSALVQTASLRRSCPTSPTALLPQTVKSSSQSTANVTPDAADQAKRLQLRSAQKPRLTALNQLMAKCDQFFHEKPAKRLTSSSTRLRLHRRSQSDFRTALP